MEITQWTALVEDAFRAGASDKWSISPVWHAPASAQTLRDLEVALVRPLPQVLGEALAVSDGIGVLMHMPEREEETGDFLWPTRRILSEAADLPAGFLFFADAGNGDSFGFSLCPGDSCDGPIVVHDHETGEVRPVLASFYEFVQRWGSGSLSI